VRNTRSVVVDTAAERAAVIAPIVIPKPVVVEPEITHMAVAGFTRLQGWKYKTQELADLGRQLTKLSKERGLPIVDILDDRYGKVHTYSIELMKEFFKVS
jgi:hypothetical protein